MKVPCSNRHLFPPIPPSSRRYAAPPAALTHLPWTAHDVPPDRKVGFVRSLKTSFYLFMFCNFVENGYIIKNFRLFLSIYILIICDNLEVVAHLGN